MNTKTPRKKHSVKANVQILDLTRAGSSITLTIFADDKKLGEIQLGQGSVNWIGKSRKVWGKPLSWTKFAEIMNESTYGI
jgi:hypothetical protein